MLLSALKFWDKLGLGQRAGKKNVCVFEESDETRVDAVALLDLVLLHVVRGPRLTTCWFVRENDLCVGPARLPKGAREWRLLKLNERTIQYGLFKLSRFKLRLFCTATFTKTEMSLTLTTKCPSTRVT